MKGLAAARPKRKIDFVKSYESVFSVEGPGIQIHYLTSFYITPERLF